MPPELTTFCANCGRPLPTPNAICSFCEKELSPPPVTGCYLCPSCSSRFERPLQVSATLGISTSPVEVTNISKYGFWLLLGDEELFLPFSEFPWFRDANVGKILHVELPSSNHLYWPDLDIDLAVESIRHPEQFPLVSHVST